MTTRPSTSWRRTAALLGSAALAFAGVAGTPTSTAIAAPTSAPTAARAGSGDIVSAQRIWAPGFEYASVWKMTYRSTSVSGAANVVSGTLIVPNDGPANMAIVGYAPGTHGLGDQCAPSVALQQGTENEGGLIHQYARAGFAVAVTDYEGLGTPGLHTYSVGAAQAHAVLDAVRAATRVTGSGLSSKAPVAIVGYSQGGQTAGWAAETAASYAPELKIKGIAVGAAPSNLRSVAEYNDGGDNFGLVFAAAVGLDAAYPELDLASHLNAAGQGAVADLSDDCTADFATYAGHHLTDYTVDDTINQPDWSARLAQQNLGTIAPTVPTLVYHSNGDEIIPVANSVNLRASWCAKGANVTFWQTDTGKHAETAAYLSPLVTQWVSDRLAGKATSGNC